MFPIIASKPAVTMSSVELVDFINSQRHEGDAELRHDHFMAKVPKVLGVDAPNFLGTQKYGNNNVREVYNFPKREACLMAMSYSYELQAKVFDRMTELEGGNLPQVVDPRTAALIESLVRFDRLEQQHKLLEAKTDNLTQRLDQIETAQTHFTVVGYMSVVANKSIPLASASTIGKRCTKLCKARDLEVGIVPDPRFGKANTYPKHILDEVLEDMVAEVA